MVHTRWHHIYIEMKRSRRFIEWSFCPLSVWDAKQFGVNGASAVATMRNPSGEWNCVVWICAFGMEIIGCHHWLFKFVIWIEESFGCTQPTGIVLLFSIDLSNGIGAHFVQCVLPVLNTHVLREMAVLEKRPFENGLLRGLWVFVWGYCLKVCFSIICFKSVIFYSLEHSCGIVDHWIVWFCFLNWSRRYLLFSIYFSTFLRWPAN